MAKASERDARSPACPRLRGHDIGAVRERFPGITWHRFGGWAGDHLALLAEASGTVPVPRR
jgi:hypothetical protein